jgi:F0F1-type ATP synthase membrane subunit b/b'
MHDTPFFDASFVFFLCFVTFMGIVLKFGYTKTIKIIDTQISQVSLTLEEAQTLLKIAQDRVDTEKQLEDHIVTEINEMKLTAQKQIEQMKQATAIEIESILQRKQISADSALDLLRNSTISYLQDSLTQEAIDLVHQKLSQAKLSEQERINDGVLLELKNLLSDTGANQNGGRNNKAIA